MEAVKQNVLALQFACEVLRNDFRVVMEAFKQKDQALEFVSNIHKKFLAELLSWNLRSGQTILKYCNEEVRDDRRIVLAILKYNGQEFQYVSQRLKNDQEVVLAAIKYDPHMLKLASEELKIA